MTSPLERPAESAGELYFRTPVTPEEAFQAIGRLRKEARDEIDRLIRFLDKTDDYVSRELEDEADAGPCDDNELDGPENDEDEDDDPAEPSLGSGSASEWNSQEGWGRIDAPRNLAAVDIEDEHDGAEPDHEGDSNENDEPSLGWTIDGVPGSQTGDDRELQDHASVRPSRDRQMPVQSIDVQDRGYGGRKVIRNLTDGQQLAMAEKMDRHGKVSLQ